MLPSLDAEGPGLQEDFGKVQVVGGEFEGAPKEDFGRGR